MFLESSLTRHSTYKRQMVSLIVYKPVAYIESLQSVIRTFIGSTVTL